MLENIFGVDNVATAIFFIGLQPHTHLEEYAFKHNILKKGYNPLAIYLPWVALKLLWNPGKLGEFFGDVCLEAMRTNPNDFGREVMAILELRVGRAPQAEALSAPVKSTTRSLAEVSS